ncbi:5'/3'-nucleotidase SurE [uncultured Methanobrevibacter sp.]|uniref:5'/3'-nucleotidase SurE n=1 Tax=uncultured Methanobrevibacter sp. TaxID=253161 RepID=UPI0025CBBA8A|nr:5'/3'-nucleotidase SurE [uncultured Methanobrevibacter sp.]
MNILISNDDGVNTPGIFAAKEAVKDLADVTVVAPEDNNSGVGRHLTMFKHLQVSSCELEDNSPAYSVSGTPADSVVIGANYIMDEKPDLVIAGINSGVNISRKDLTSSGTVCAALEAVAMGIPAISVSLFMDYTSFEKDEDGNWHLNQDFELSKKILKDCVLKIQKKGFPEGVDLFNLNIPSNCLSENIKITRLSDKMLNKTVIDDKEDSLQEIFTYEFKNNTVPNEFIEDDTHKIVMITSKLNESHEEGTDGHCLMVEKRPSLTPLNVDMSVPVSKLESWY